MYIKNKYLLQLSCISVAVYNFWRNDDFKLKEDIFEKNCNFELRKQPLIFSYIYIINYRNSYKIIDADPNDKNSNIIKDFNRFLDILMNFR